MGFCNVWELCMRYNLSLRAQPTQSKENSNYTPCFNELCDTLSHLPCPLSSLSVPHLSPPVSLGSSLFSIEALLGVVGCPVIHKPFSSVVWRGRGRSLALLPLPFHRTAHGLWKLHPFHRYLSFFMEGSCTLSFLCDTIPEMRKLWKDGPGLKIHQIFSDKEFVKLFSVNHILLFTSV